MDDIALLHEYARTGAERPFAVLVERHLGLVYSAARRQVRDAQIAEDVTQAVFLVLARKAEQVAHHPGLGGWLLQTTRYAANAHIRAAIRRVKREQEAAMQAEPVDSSSADWSRLAPHLDEAMASLGAKDRAVLALRYFENKTAAEIAEVMELNEEAARKRANRALEKLRKFFGKRGITLSAAALAGCLAANSVSAAPEGLGTKISAVAVAKLAAKISTMAMVKSTLNALAWGQYKIAVACGLAVLVVGTAMVVTIPPKPVKPVASVHTNPVAMIREPLTGAMKFMLETPPGGLAIQPDGKIIVGTTLFGRFVDETSGALGFYTRGAFRLNPDGSLDRTFRCDVTPPGDAPQMSHVDVLHDGRIFLSGMFGTVDGQSRPDYAVLNVDGTCDDSFQPWRGETNQPQPFFLPTLKEPVIWGLTSYQGAIMPATWMPDDTVAIFSRAIDVTKYTHYPTLTAYRLDAAGKWIKPSTNNILAGTFARPSGLADTLTLTGFWPRMAINWTNSDAILPRPPYRYGSELLKLEENPPVNDLPFDRWTNAPNATHASIVLRAIFEEVPIDLCRYAVKLPDGGAILAIRDTPNNATMKVAGRLMRFDRNWLPDFSFTNHYECDLRSCLSVKRLPDGKLLVAGLIGKMNGEDFSGLMRLMPDGAVDHSFHCDIENTMNGRVMDWAVQDDGKIVIGGFFSQVDGVDVPHIARLNPDGSLDTSFQTVFLSDVNFYKELRKTRRMAVARLSKPSGTNQPAAPAAVPESILITLMKMKPDGALIQFSGTANHGYVLQAKDSLNGGDWMTISTNQTAGDGTGSFRDADAMQHPMRFYRIATP